jgi:hypothetical protein
MVIILSRNIRTEFRSQNSGVRRKENLKDVVAAAYSEFWLLLFVRLP